MILCYSSLSKCIQKETTPSALWGGGRILFGEFEFLKREGLLLYSSGRSCLEESLFLSPLLWEGVAHGITDIGMQVPNCGPSIWHLALSGTVMPPNSTSSPSTLLPCSKLSKPSCALPVVGSPSSWALLGLHLNGKHQKYISLRPKLSLCLASAVTMLVVWHLLSSSLVRILCCPGL